MTRYIKDKHGKFAGSIADGKSTVPSPKPTMPRTVDTAASPPPPTAEIPPAPGVFTARITYTNFISVTDDGSQHTHLPDSALPARPHPDDQAHWPITEHQRDLDAHYLGTTGLRSTLLDGIRYTGVQPGELSTLATRCRQTAADLRLRGMHHQAYAMEWTADTASGLDDTLYELYERVEDGSEHTLTVAVDTPDGWVAGIVTNYGNSFSELNTDTLTEDFYAHADLTIRLRDLDADAHQVYSGAVLADMLPTTNGDLDAAAAMTSLLPNPYHEH